MMRRPVPSPEQCIAIVSFDDRSDAGLFNAAFGLLYGCGAYLEEVLDIRRRDVSISERTLLAITGVRQRTLPVPKGAAARLLLLLNRGTEYVDDEFVFRTTRGRIRQWAINDELARRSRVLGFRQQLVTRDLRIAFARHMTDRQTPVEVITEMMGYKDINSLQRLLANAGS